MNIASEIKRCIEVVRREGYKIEVRPPMELAVETIKRRYQDSSGRIHTDSRKIKLLKSK